MEKNVKINNFFSWIVQNAEREEKKIYNTNCSEHVADTSNI